MATPSGVAPRQNSIPGLGARGLDLPVGMLTFGEWAEIGAQIGRFTEAFQWALGDWCQYGEQFAKHERYNHAIDATGVPRERLHILSHVCSRFAALRRRKDLSFEHHRVLAALSIEDQERWLDYAEDHKLSRDALRDALQEGVPGVENGRPVSALASGTRFVLRIEPDQNSLWVMAAETAGLKLEEWAVKVLDREAKALAA